MKQSFLRKFTKESYEKDKKERKIMFSVRQCTILKIGTMRTDLKVL